MEASGIAHVSFGLASLVLGVGIFSVAKGTNLHRAVGALYVFSMFGLHVTALVIYRIFGRFGVFHMISLINLAMLLAGFGTVLLKRPRKRWLRYHYYLMGWTYVGLCAATLTEITVRVVRWPFAVAIIVPTIIVVVVGGALVRLREQQTLPQLGGRTIGAA